MRNRMILHPNTPRFLGDHTALELLDPPLRLSGLLPGNAHKKNRVLPFRLK